MDLETLAGALVIARGFGFAEATGMPVDEDPKDWGARLARDLLADSLDAAWNEAEAALGTRLWAIEVIGRSPEYLANVYPTDDTIDAASPDLNAAGTTPAAALRALTAKLRER